MKRTIAHVKHLSAYNTGKDNTYQYLVKEGKTVENGDIVVVENKLGYALAQVVSVVEDRIHETYKYKYVIEVITEVSDTFKEMKSKVRKEEIKKEIKERMKKVDETEKMKMYAEKDPAIAELLKLLEE